MRKRGKEIKRFPVVLSALLSVTAYTALLETTELMPGNALATFSILGFAFLGGYIIGTQYDK